MRYVDWLGTLNDKQIRALACHCKVAQWNKAPVPKLRKRLISNERGREVYQQHYGEETDIQE